MKTLGYIRVSTDEQAQEGVSLDAQRAKITAYAELYGLELIDIIEDAGESGKNMARPGMDEVLMRLGNNEAEAVVVAKLDRLTRSLKDLLGMIDEYFSQQYSLLSVSEQLDPRTASGRLVINILAAVAQWELETISERTKAALAHKRSNGEYTGGLAPYGYAIGDDGMLVPVPEEQETIKYAKAVRGAGLSLRQIGSILDARHPTRNGKPWTAQQVSRLIKTRGMNNGGQKESSQTG
jgi:DNA invertase Pin-like site-specific DNA recombinase